MPELRVPELDDDTLTALAAQGEEQADFLRRIKHAVHEMESDADLWLFGSYARGDARPESN